MNLTLVSSSLNVGGAERVMSIITTVDLSADLTRVINRKKQVNVTASAAK